MFNQYSLAGRTVVAAAVCAAMLAGCSSSKRTDAEKLTRIEEVYTEMSPDFAPVPEITAADLLKAIKQGDERIVLVDTRKEKTWTVSMIPGAITRKQFEADRAKYAGARIVCYCVVGYASGMYVKEISGGGLRVENLRGGVLSWTHAGGTLVDPDGEPTRRLHVEESSMDLAPDGYEAIW